jgi:outer membrane biosynthesis protein TonB
MGQFRMATALAVVLAAAALSGCTEIPSIQSSDGPPGGGWYVERPPIAEPLGTLDLGDANDNPPAPALTPRHHYYQQPPVTAEPEPEPDEPPVAALPPQPAPTPEPEPPVISPPPQPAPPPENASTAPSEPDQRSLRDRLGLPPSVPSSAPTDTSSGQCGWWRLCNFWMKS